ncbi:MAG TPA: hypothetical protein VFJ55_03560 [Chthoniobacterales bacterium]|nr:hypothetical protein [Chthoniobacterales bacterium]
MFTKSLLVILSILLIADLCAPAATDREKAFVEKYKTALEKKDTATLQSCLYTTGADPMIIGFYKMMQSNGEGDKVSKIDLVDLTPDDVKKATEPQDGPSGKVCLNLKPTKKLVIVIEKKDENGSSTNTTENFIAEKDGKFVIPVPGPCK